MANASEVEPINNAECIKRYAGRDGGLTDLIVVTSNLTMEDQQSFAVDNTSSLLSNFTTPGPPTDWYASNNWLCSAWKMPGERLRVWCTDQFLGPQSHNWTYHGDQSDFRTGSKEFWAKIDHCIPAGDAHDMDGSCALRVSTVILFTVCILNLFKCICICWVAHIHGQTSKATNPNHTSSYRRAFALLSPWARVISTEAPQQLQSPTSRGPDYLVTIGDAIASFLEVEDTNTIKMPVVGKDDFTGNWPDDSTTAREPVSMQWNYAASKRRWLVTISL